MNSNNAAQIGHRQNSVDHIIVDQNSIDNKFDVFNPSLVPSIPDPRGQTPVPHMQHIQVSQPLRKNSLPFMGPFSALRCVSEVLTLLEPIDISTSITRYCEKTRKLNI